MLLLELSFVDGLDKLTLSKLLNLEDLVSFSDEVGYFNFNFGSVDVKWYPLLAPTSVVISFKVDKV